MAKYIQSKIILIISILLLVSGDLSLAQMPQVHNSSEQSTFSKERLTQSLEEYIKSAKSDKKIKVSIWLESIELEFLEGTKEITRLFPDVQESGGRVFAKSNTYTSSEVLDKISGERASVLLA